MTWRLNAAVIAFGLLAGCASRSSIKPVEVLDERTGTSVAALQYPIVMVQDRTLVIGKRSSFAYLGPVEWNRMGDIRYGLWLHMAPGDDRPLGDMRGQAAATLMLDDGTLVLSLINAPPLGREPYRPAAPWGQTAYFDLTIDGLRRLAASPHLALQFRAADGASVLFKTGQNTQRIFGVYLQSRGLTPD